MRSAVKAGRIALTLTLACGCVEEPAHTLAFTELAGPPWIDFHTVAGEVPSSQILEVKGGGIALLDHDRDGDLDVFVPNGATLEDTENGPGSRLFAIEGALSFRDVTSVSGIELGRWAMGVCAGDVDGNGLADLYVTCFGPDVLLRNGGERFTAVDQAEKEPREWSSAAAFGDLDLDGDLDLYVAHYLRFDPGAPPPPSTFKGAPVFKGPRGLAAEADRLFRNTGDGTFTELSEGWGRVEEPAYGLGVVILDFDRDGKQDIYVGNDSTPNVLYRNGGEFRFENIATRAGLAANIDGSTQSTMGIGIADVSGNGYPDVFTTNFSNDANTLHVNKGGRFFDDETRRYGLGMRAFPLVGWACGLHDFDLDGDEDLLLFDGHVYPNARYELMDSDYRQPPMLYAREGPHFRQVGPEEAGPFLARARVDRGAAFGDLDLDGDVDAVVFELNGPVRILRNDVGGGNWLAVTLADGTRRGLGARIEARSGTWSAVRWIHSGGSFLSASAPEAHFGLPRNVHAVDVTVHWPDGTSSELEDVGPNRRIRVER